MIAIIPARGGSKGLPGKNIKDLCGKPLIAYTIEAALSSEFVSRVIVSTDSDEIASISEKYGAEIPFMRPEHLSRDQSLAIDNYIYTMDRLNGAVAEKDQYQNCIVLQPTSPLRTFEDIDASIHIFLEKQATSVISVVEAQHPVAWYKKIDKKGRLSDYYTNDIGNKNRQEIEQAFLPNGAIYIFNYLMLKNTMNYYSDKTYSYEMAMERSVDIDTYFDFVLAEFLIARSGIK